VVFLIIGGSASQKLAAKIAKELDCSLVPMETRRFPDGERYIRIKGQLDSEVIVVQSTGYPQDENLIELFLILKDLKSMGIEKIRVVIPYFGYGRQEKRFKDGEAISAIIISELLEFSGADEIFCINLHEESIINFSKIPVHNLSAMPIIAEYIKKIVNNPVIIAPDKGAIGFAKEIAEIIGCKYDYLEKVRISPEIVETKPKNMDVNGKDTVIIDDIISTGGTIVNAARILKELGASKVIVSCAHPVLVEDALLKIFASGVDDVVSTDTILSEVGVISIAPLVAKALKK
jgi:ribose-phosphate pyrophosphokinase